MKMHHNHATKKHLVISISAVVLLFLIAETFTIYFILVKSNELSSAINQTALDLNEKITSNKVETQSQINTLIETLGSVSSAQTDLEKQMIEVKAKASSDFSGIIEAEIKGVVTIKTDVSQATGFLITEDGYVVTNAHVLSGARMANVYTYNSGTYSASLIGYNLDIDVALLKIKGNFPSLDLGNSDDVKIGEKVIAIGNPLGLSFTATEGIISARDREGINNKPYYFQTDVSLNPGNSGGPLIATNGKVIGINNFKVSDAEGIGFALQINEAKKVINEIAVKVTNSTIV